MVIHCVALLVLASIIISPEARQVATLLGVMDRGELEPSVAELQLRDLDTPAIPRESSSAESLVHPSWATLPAVAENISPSQDLDAAPVRVDLSDFGEQTAPRSDLMMAVGALAGSSLEGRGSANRAGLVKKFGGTEGSERAVSLALRWLAAHQLPDGSWNFDHRTGMCQGQCTHPGNLEDCPNGATAMALLPFLGAGQTHQEGQYKDQVKAGLTYLLRSMSPEGSLAQGGGNMYAHGLASIAICEAYAMTRDQELMAPAQATINYIVQAQDPAGGGWRYAPRQPGDTSVVGWQLMALKSAHMAYLNVPRETVRGAGKFLDEVQTNRGAHYRYMSHLLARQTTTAVGLLCRMYLGWKKDHRGLQRGVDYLSKTGPSKGDMYYNYYATQVLRHWDGDEWKKWNEVMREHLVNTQSHSGHMLGSWIVEGDDDRGIDRGGRLYCTSLATMILEVYYRHMPLYAQGAAEQDFPLH
jgi:hypothetical protein